MVLIVWFFNFVTQHRINISLTSPQVQDFLIPKLRKVINFLRARFTWGQNQRNQQGRYSLAFYNLNQQF